MKTLSISQVTHKNITAGFPSVEGWMIDSDEIVCNVEGAKACKSYNSRNYTVCVDGKFIGNVYAMSGGRYAAITADQENIFSTAEQYAELICFCELVATAQKSS